MKDCAVFCYNEDGELEQLTNWLKKVDAEKYIDSGTYFRERKQILLQQISKSWN
jgi:hypothetical protein